MKAKKKHIDIIKASRRGSRNAELENSTGWSAVLKIHPNKKRYQRHTKHKKSGNNPDFFFTTSSPAQLAGGL